MRAASIVLTSLLTSTLSLGGVTLLAASSAGCGLMQGLQPETRLTDQVYMLNDEARWGRIDLAAMRVAPTYRATFVRSHRTWGRTIAIGDVDVTNVAILQDRAQSLVTYSWIDQRTMQLQETTVRQTWTGEMDGFALSGEEVVDGADGLFVEVEGGPTRLPNADDEVLIGDPGTPSQSAELETSGGEEEAPASQQTVAQSSTRGSARRVDAQGLPIR